MDMMSNYTPTSKSSLKRFCLMTSGGDVKKASDLYDFMIKDLEDLPTFDPIPPSFIDNAKNTVTGLFSFVQENKDGIGQVVDIVRAVMGKSGAAASTTATEALPSIN